MRKILLLLCLFSVLSSYSQGLIVKSLSQDDNRLVGRTNNKKDLNGVDEAVLHVVLPVPNVEFKGGNVDGTPQFNGSTYTLYMLNGTRIIEINCPGFPPLQVKFKDYGVEELKGPNDYTMIVDVPGISDKGRFVNINTKVVGATVSIDGKEIGIAPIYNYFLYNGKYLLTAQSGKYEGALEINISNLVDAGTKDYTIPMENVESSYGRVHVTADKDANIIFDGRIVGTGEWSTELRKGNYSIETQKPQCDNAITNFEVKAGQLNKIQANNPRPHQGELLTNIRPLNATLTVDGHSEAINTPLTLSVGKHILNVSSNGYTAQSREVNIERNKKTVEAISLDRIYYLKKNGMYFGGAYTLGAFSSATPLIGVVVSNIDIQFNYSFGLDESKEVYFYDKNEESDKFIGGAKYSCSSMGIKLGYQIPLSMKFAIVPQVGYTLNKLSGKLVTGTMQGDGAVCNCAAVGGKFIFSPIQHICLFAAPEYDIAVKSDKIYDSISSEAGFAKGGFNCHLGLLINF